MAALGWLLASAVITSPVQATTGPDPVHGQAVAAAHCAACHAIGRSGGSPLSQAPPFRDLHQRFPVADVIGAIGQGATASHPEMPHFHLDDDDSLALAAYVLSIQDPTR